MPYLYNSDRFATVMFVSEDLTIRRIENRSEVLKTGSAEFIGHYVHTHETKGEWLAYAATPDGPILFTEHATAMVRDTRIQNTIVDQKTRCIQILGPLSLCWNYPRRPWGWGYGNEEESDVDDFLNLVYWRKDPRFERQYTMGSPTWRHHWIPNRSIDQICIGAIGSPYDRLSNMSPHPIVMEEEQWPTVAHYILGQRFAGTELQKRIQHAPTPQQAQHLADESHQDGAQVSATIMRKAVKAKFTQHSIARYFLMATSTATICDNNQGTTPGQLGEILMSVRDEILAET